MLKLNAKVEVSGGASAARFKSSSSGDGLRPSPTSCLVKFKGLARFKSLALLALGLLRAVPALAQDSSDPAGSSVIVNAVAWLQGTLLGTFATIVAVIAVASVGFMMLTGRINWRHGAVVILGCFILFGAASIVSGIRTVSAGS